MALFPCAVGSHRYVGPQTSLYLGLVNGSASARSKLRLCPTHGQDWKNWLDRNTRLAAIGEISQDDGPEAAGVCHDCGKLEHSGTAYANLYLRGEEPRTYWANFCDEHALAFAEKGSITI